MPRSLQTPKGKPYTQRGSNLLAEPEAGGASAQALPPWIRGFLTTLTSGFPGGSGVKHTPAQAGDVGLIPGSGRSPGEGNGNPLQYSCLDNPTDRGACWASHGVAKSRTCLSTSTTTLTRPFPMRRPRRKGGTFLFLLGPPHPSASFATQPTLGIQDLCQRDVFTLLSHQPPPLSAPALGGGGGVVPVHPRQTCRGLQSTG